MQLTQFYVEMDRHDATIAGALGDVEWIENTICTITTDDPDAMTARLDGDENVLLYVNTEEIEGAEPEDNDAFIPQDWDGKTLY